MDQNDFPALFRAADSASNEAQKSLLLYHRLNNVLLVVGAALAAWSATSCVMALISAACFLASLFLYIYGKSNDLQAKWYQSRALAESIKTATWRFVMASEPFHQHNEGDCLESFRALLKELLAGNQGIGAYLASADAGGDQITSGMLTLRRKMYPEKRDIYLKDRINDQRDWYYRKSRANSKSSRKWFNGLCIVYAIVIICLLVRISAPEMPFLPVDVLAVTAGCIIGWIQLKRFDELASAYSLTAHEIGIIQTRFHAVLDGESLSRFVSDAENAFSREHTQWAARRDHAP